MNRKTWISFALGLAVIPVGAAAAQDSEPVVPLALREAQQLLVAAYPELREGRVAWNLDASTPELTLAARRVESVSELTNGAPPLVGARVTTDEEGHVRELRTHGTLIASVRQRVAPTPGRTRSVDEVLAAADATFTPTNTEALEALVPVGVARLLGAHAVRARTFRVEGSIDAPEDALTWRVETEGRAAEAPRYTLVFDPVEGRLLSLVRQ